MRRSVRFAVVSALLAGFLAPAVDGTAYARDKDRRGYKRIGKLVGLWQGVDGLDGSTIKISIADFDGDKVLDFRWHESFFTNCFGDDNQLGRGIAVGTLHQNSSKRFELEAINVICFNDDNTTSDRAPFKLQFRYLKDEDILIGSGDDSRFSPVILHRTSSRGDD